MTASFQQFRARASLTLQDDRLQEALDRTTGGFIQARQAALAELPGAEALRHHFKAMRTATLARLAHHLETFEANAAQNGAQIHWAESPAEVRSIVTSIARERGVRRAVKSKSMTTEEIDLNDALQSAGVAVVETDLGEWVLQLADEKPFHIIAPAIHKRREQAAELVNAQDPGLPPVKDIQAITARARQLLRREFLEAGIGISGANLAVAESGSLVLVTNEGNGRMVTSLPPVHVAIVGIEKVAATWDEAAAWLSLLARSATGQPLSVYTTIVSGPARSDDPDGPSEVHVILLDNRRGDLLETTYEEALSCIRCGACLNACPVYREAGGHAYGSPYNGPIGAVITPLLFGLKEYEALPHASSLCGACLEACPVRIDLPRMLLELRRDEVEMRIAPWPDRLAERAAAFILAHARLAELVARLLRLLQRPLVRDGNLNLPAWLHPAAPRRLPPLAKRSFRELWASGEGRAKYE